MLAWIAAVLAVPVTIGGWFFGAERKTNKSVARRGTTATAGDIHSGTSGIVTGHHSSVTLNLALGSESKEKTARLLARWVITAVTLVVRYFGHHEADEITIPCRSLSLFDPEYHVESDASGIPRSRSLIRPAYVRATGIDRHVIAQLTWKPTQLLFDDSETGKRIEFFVYDVDIISELDGVNFFINSLE